MSESEQDIPPGAAHRSNQRRAAITFRMPREALANLRETAAAQGISVQVLLERIVFDEEAQQLRSGPQAKSASQEELALT